MPAPHEHRQRLAAAVDDYVRHGSRRPMRARLVQLTRLLGFVAGGIVVVSLTDGVGSPLDVASWWAEPIVIEKFAIWTLLWQLLGLGRGLAPFGVAALPPVAGLSYWLTPGTMRLAPWPQLPGTSGTRRTVVDVALYAVVVAVAGGLLGFTGSDGGVLPTAPVWTLLVALAVLGLRDRTPLLAARPEIVAPVLFAFTLPASDTLLALQLVLAALCWLAVSLAANRHLPFAVAVTLTDAPWVRATRLRRALWQRDDHDLQPGDVSRWTASGLIGLGFVLPVLLLAGRGGWLTTLAVTLGLLLLVALASTMSRRSQLESATFVGYAGAAVFGPHAAVAWSSAADPVALALLAALLVAGVAIAAAMPQATSLLSPWRHAAGAGPVSLWLLRADAADRWHVPELAVDDADELIYRDLAILDLHPSGRALDGLLHRAVPDLDGVLVRPAEYMSGAALGWAVDAGYGHDSQLLAAVQERCGFEPGELRVVTLEAHSMIRSDYRYRVLDAATGLLEVGAVDVDDMIDRVPWRDPARPAIPVEVAWSVTGASGYLAPENYGFGRPAAPSVVAASPSPGTWKRPAPMQTPIPTRQRPLAPARLAAAMAPRGPRPHPSSAPAVVTTPATPPAILERSAAAPARSGSARPRPADESIVVASISGPRPERPVTSSLLELAVDALHNARGTALHGARGTARAVAPLVPVVIRPQPTGRS